MVVQQRRQISGLRSRDCDHKKLGDFLTIFWCSDTHVRSCLILKIAQRTCNGHVNALFFTFTANFETQQLDNHWEFFYAASCKLERNTRTVDSDGYLFLITVPWFRIRGRVSGEWSRKTLRRNILTTSANFSTPQVANLNATWKLSIPILFEFKLTCFDLAWHGTCSADFDPHD